ncbi:MAG TPA: thiamine diphosphokinase [Bacteroidota bacterium]|nr:thiamine diphosphokinase [Bacteroidota bacterium]
MKLRTKRKKKARTALVICNGEVLSKKEIAPLLKENPFIVCADGGADKARARGIRPDVIIGDLDSISPGTRSYFSDVRTIHVKSQHSTDLEKALTFLLKHGYRSAVVAGTMGGRPDHAYTNFSILKKYQRRMDLLFVDPLCDIRIVGRSIAFDASVGTIVSLMPLGRCDGISTTGLKYPIRNGSLELGVHEGASNKVVSSPVTVSVKKGSLLLFIVKSR